MTSMLDTQKTLSQSITLSNVALVGIGSLLIAISAQFSVTLPFLSFVPFTLQNHCVFLLAALLGPTRGFMCICLYLLEGASGLPVFTHGRGGLLYLAGPSAGYLLGYLPVSYFIGKCFEKYNNANWSQRVAFITMGNAMNILCGTLWLTAFVGAENAWKIGAYPFLATCMIKTLLLASILPLLKSNFSKFLDQQ